jgi:hypothetical protein
MEQFYAEMGNNTALQSVRRYRTQLGIDQPWLF